MFRIGLLMILALLISGCGGGGGGPVGEPIIPNPLYIIQTFWVDTGSEWISGPPKAPLDAGAKIVVWSVHPRYPDVPHEIVAGGVLDATGRAEITVPHSRPAIVIVKGDRAGKHYQYSHIIEWIPKFKSDIVILIPVAGG